jgi:asparagine synthase (glutamine-hydrolysing)
MVASLDHRGPDDKGCAQFTAMSGQSIGIGSTRLAIIDVSQAGHQPMDGPTGTTHLVYNGEIYNYRELRAELSEDGTPWRSQTDSEVILRAYARWGVAFLPRLRGMFAFGIWDSKREQLLVARDPFGIKPLYYYSCGGTFAFASEVRALLESGLVPRKLSPQGLTSYLQFGSVAGPLTVVDGVRSLPPGHCLTVKPDGDHLRFEEKSYVEDLFNQSKAGQVSDREEAVATLRSKLEESIRLHLVSDVSLAAFLSGGIDSSAIVGLMSRVTSDRPRTFTVVFDEKEFSEQSYARIVARRFGTEHQEVPVAEGQLLAMLPDALAAMDQPTMDGINTYVISKAVKEAGITVALSGLGGDELFAGYPSFRRARRLRKLAAIPAPVRTAVARTGNAVMGGSVQRRKAWDLLAGGGTPYSAYSASRRVFGDSEISGLLCENGVNPLLEAIDRDGIDSQSFDAINAVSLFELQGYMANTLLRDTDQMSMAHSLEARVPFVDIDIVSFVLGLPGEWKIDGPRPKPLLLDALGDLLPEEIWRRPKMGFTFPFDRWMRSALKPEIDKTFDQPGKLEEAGVAGSFARDIWNRFLNNPSKERWSRPWSLHVLKRWCEINGVRL